MLYVTAMLMVDRRPDGLRVVTMDNWTGTGIAFRRFDAKKARARDELGVVQDVCESLADREGRVDATGAPRVVDRRRGALTPCAA